MIKRGIVKADHKYADVKPMAKKCMFCHFDNGVAEKFCSRCRRPLDREVIERVEKKKEDESRKLREEMVAIKKQLAQSESRDELILRMIKSLARKGKMRDVVDAVVDEGLAEELVKMG